MPLAVVTPGWYAPHVEPAPSSPRRASPAGGRAIRALAAALVATALLLPGTGTALGWANNDDGYSTHDWFIDQAVKVLDGRAADWFDASAARLASDDPDTTPALADGLSHIYRDTGLRGGAVQLVSEHYSAAVAHYREGAAARDAGDSTAAGEAFRAASREIGLLSHYYTDILQPYHSGSLGVSLGDEADEYEMLVAQLTRRASDSPDWQSSVRTVDRVVNVRAMAIAAAALSRTYLSEVHANIRDHPGVLTTRVREITGRLCRRAAQDLADIIWSVSRGVGESPNVARLSARVKWTGVAATEPYQAVWVTARDASGTPIEGLEVTIKWPKADGSTATIQRFTDPTGVAKYTAAVGGGPLMTKRIVSASATATTAAATKTATTWFQATPRLAAGSAGYRTVVSDVTVVAGQTVVVTSVARDTAGRPVEGLLVTWSWKYGTRTITTTGFTDANGRARSSRLIRSTTTTTTVTVTAHTQAASSNRYSSTSFRRVD